MAYSEIEQISSDLDVFFTDGVKLIHFASGGGRLPERLIDSDVYNENTLSYIIGMNAFEYPDVEIEINPNLQEILNLELEEINSYLGDFIQFAKRGLYTYDKTKLGEFDDFTFHLVARPKNIRIKEFYSLSLINANIELPNSFTTFNLKNYI